MGCYSIWNRARQVPRAPRPDQRGYRAYSALVTLRARSTAAPRARRLRHVGGGPAMSGPRAVIAGAVVGVFECAGAASSDGWMDRFLQQQPAHDGGVCRFPSVRGPEVSGFHQPTERRRCADGSRRRSTGRSIIGGLGGTIPGYTSRRRSHLPYRDQEHDKSSARTPRGLSGGRGGRVSGGARPCVRSGSPCDRRALRRRLVQAWMRDHRRHH